MTLYPCENSDCNNLIERTVKNPKWYCSRACRQHCYRERKKARFGAGTGKPFYQHQCQNCGRWFDSKRADAKFCKDSCRSSFCQQQKRLAAKMQH